MKKKILLLFMVIMILLTGCDKTKTEETDSEKFKKEYSGVSEYNVFVYKNADDIIKILEHGTAVVYLGFPECQWCQAYVPMLNEVADIEGLEKIYYFNISEDRKNNTEEYQKMVSILNDKLQYDDEGNKRIYVPTVVAVSDGEILAFDDETSYDTLGFDNPEEYWNDERKSALKDRLTDLVNKVIDNKCNDCNE